MTSSATFTNDPAPNRRWFRFSLRTMLIVAASISCVLGSWGWNVRQANFRRALLDSYYLRGIVVGSAQSQAGLKWRLFGESTVLVLQVKEGSYKEAHIERLRSTFSQAEIWCRSRSIDPYTNRYELLGRISEPATH